MSSAKSSPRYKRGFARLTALDPRQPQALKSALAGVAPELADYAIEFVFGDIYSRPGLDLRTRQMLTVTMLATAGNAPLQLKGHLGIALNVGVSPVELREILIQTTAYAGFPTALNGLYLLKEVLQERGLTMPADETGARNRGRD